MSNNPFVTVKIRRDILDAYRNVITYDLEPDEKAPTNAQLVEHAIERMTDTENYVVYGD